MKKVKKSEWPNLSLQELERLLRNKITRIELYKLDIRKLEKLIKEKMGEKRDKTDEIKESSDRLSYGIERTTAGKIFKELERHQDRTEESGPVVFIFPIEEWKKFRKEWLPNLEKDYTNFRKCLKKEIKPILNNKIGRG